MDAGPIWAQEEIAIRPDETTAPISYAWAKGLPLPAANIEPDHLGQDPQASPERFPGHHGAGDQKSEGRVDWRLPAQRLYDHLRAFTPWPGLFFDLEKRQIKILNAGVSRKRHNSQEGRILELDAQSLQVACGLGTVLEITSIQPEGKKAMSPWQYSLGTASLNSCREFHHPGRQRPARVFLRPQTNLRMLLTRFWRTIPAATKMR